MDARKAYAVGISEEWRSKLLPHVPQGLARITIAVHSGGEDEYGNPVPAIVVAARRGGTCAAKAVAMMADPQHPDDWDEGLAEFLNICAQLDSELKPNPVIITREELAASEARRAQAENPDGAIQRPTGTLHRLDHIPVEVQRAMHRAGIN